MVENYFSTKVIMVFQHPTRPPLKSKAKTSNKHTSRSHYTMDNNNISIDSPPPPPETAAKLRIMCSYGGRLVPAPHKLKSLYYASGDTRIISIPAAAASASLAAFSSVVAAALQVGYPFTLKYQLPLHELDSLVSLSSDEDLVIFLQELHRPSSGRVRLFLVPAEPSSTQCQHGLTHPKTESWFSDALKSAKMMQTAAAELRGETGGSGGQESLFLETTSSFGSSSSSVSLSTLPPIDNKTLLPSNDSTASDIGSVMGAGSYAQPLTYQDPVIPAVENKVSLNAVDLLDGKVPDLVPELLPVHKTVQVAGYPLSTQLDQLQQQQLQFIQMGNPTSVLPVTSYYPSYSTMSPHQPIQHLSNQSYPVYVVPVAPAQGYNASPQYCCSKESMPVVSGRPPLHPNTSVNPPQVVCKEVDMVPPIPGFVSQVYKTNANSPGHIPYNESKQQNVVAAQVHNQSLPIGVTSRKAANYSNEHDDDAARAQIYKSQPPPPILPSQYQTMTGATTVLLSEALAQLHMDDIKQPVKNAQPL